MTDAYFRNAVQKLNSVAKFEVRINGFSTLGFLCFPRRISASVGVRFIQIEATTSPQETQRYAEETQRIRDAEEAPREVDHFRYFDSRGTTSRVSF